MPAETRVFLDTNVLFAAILSETGGSRLILKLGEASAIRLFAGPRVLQEADRVLVRKAPQHKGLLALLLDRANVVVGPAPDDKALEQASAIVEYAPDARVLAEAIAVGSDYFVSLDRKHLVDSPRAPLAPFPIGTPGDFLAWFRERTQAKTG